jgi:carbonic anhydrase
MCQACEAGGLAHGPSRRALFGSLAAFAATGLVLAGPAFANEHAPAAPKPQNVLSPDAALARLMAGNARFVKGAPACHDFKDDREALTGGQNPYAAILACADSRIALELTFDSGLGDLFACRVAGNFVNDDVVASLEYAVAHLATPLIMVMGHGGCGAVAATIESLKTGVAPPGHLPSLVANIAPAVQAAQGMPGDLLANAIRENVIQTVAKLKAAGPIISAAATQGKVRIVGGVYSLADGRVDLVA